MTRRAPVSVTVESDPGDRRARRNGRGQRPRHRPEIAAALFTAPPLLHGTGSGWRSRSASPSSTTASSPSSSSRRPAPRSGWRSRWRAPRRSASSRRRRGSAGQRAPAVVGVAPVGELPPSPVNAGCTPARRPVSSRFRSSRGTSRWRRPSRSGGSVSPARSGVRPASSASAFSPDALRFAPVTEHVELEPSPEIELRERSPTAPGGRPGHDAERGGELHEIGRDGVQHPRRGVRPISASIRTTRVAPTARSTLACRSFAPRAMMQGTFIWASVDTASTVDSKSSP